MSNKSATKSQNDIKSMVSDMRSDWQMIDDVLESCETAIYRWEQLDTPEGNANAKDIYEQVKAAFAKWKAAVTPFSNLEGDSTVATENIPRP